MRQKFVTIFIFVTIALAIASCDVKQDEREKAFKKNFEVFINSSDNTVSLESLTAFSWNKVCLFKPAGSQPNSGYLHYQEHIKSLSNLTSPIGETEDYIFLFSNNDDDFVHVIFKAPLSLGKKKYYFDFQSDLSSGRCFTKGVTAERQESQVIFLN